MKAGRASGHTFVPSSMIDLIALTPTLSRGERESRIPVAIGLRASARAVSSVVHLQLPGNATLTPANRPPAALQ